MTPNSIVVVRPTPTSPHRLPAARTSAMSFLLLLVLVYFISIAAAVRCKHSTRLKTEQDNEVLASLPSAFPHPKHSGMTMNGTLYSSISHLIPSSYNWCSTPDGYSYCTALGNQFAPHACGSCWALATSSSISDRVKIYFDRQRKKAARSGFLGSLGGLLARSSTNSSLIPPEDILLSVQEIMDCSKKVDLGDGCNGGEAEDVFEFIYRYGIVGESCNPYQARDNVRQCDFNSRCFSCIFDENSHKKKQEIGEVCESQSHYPLYHISGYGKLTGEKNILAELYSRGPVVCGMATNDEFDFKYRSGIFRTDELGEINHEVSIVGYGVDPQSFEAFWIVRNTYGTEWGMNGFFYIPRGVDPKKNARIEEDCAFAVIQPDQLIELVDTKTKSKDHPAEPKSSQKGEAKKPAKEERQKLNLAETNVFVDSSMLPETSALSSSPSAFTWKTPRATFWLFVYFFICLLFVYLLFRSRPLVFRAYDGTKLPASVSTSAIKMSKMTKEERHGTIEFGEQSIQFIPPPQNCVDRIPVQKQNRVEPENRSSTVHAVAECRVPLLSATTSYGTI